MIEILDRIESHRKPRMLARVFRAYGAGEINAVMFHQLGPRYRTLARIRNS
jgi:hypothetical protein